MYLWLSQNGTVDAMYLALHRVDIAAGAPPDDGGKKPYVQLGYPWCPPSEFHEKAIDPAHFVEDAGCIGGCGSRDNTHAGKAPGPSPDTPRILNRVKAN